MSGMRGQTVAFWGLLALTLLVEICVAVDAPVLLQAIAGIPFVLLAPGYGLLGVLIPRTPEGGGGQLIGRRLDRFDRVAFSVAASIALVPLSLLVSKTVGIAITPNYVIHLLAVLNFLLLTTAIVRARNVMAPATSGAGKPTDGYANRPKQWMAVGALAIVVSLLLGFVLSEPRAVPSATSLAFDPRSIDELDQPVELGSTISFSIWIKSGAAESVQQELQVYIVVGAANTTSFIEVGRELVDSKALNIGADEEMTHDISIQAPSEPGRYRILATLVADGAEIKREIYAGFEVTRPAT